MGGNRKVRGLFLVFVVFAMPVAMAYPSTVSGQDRTQDPYRVAQEEVPAILEAVARFLLVELDTLSLWLGQGTHPSAKTLRGRSGGTVAVSLFHDMFSEGRMEGVDVSLDSLAGGLAAEIRSWEIPARAQFYDMAELCPTASRVGPGGRYVRECSFPGDVRLILQLSYPVYRDPGESVRMTLHMYTTERSQSRQEHLNHVVIILGKEEDDWFVDGLGWGASISPRR